MRRQKAETPKVLLIIADGLGYCKHRMRSVLQDTWEMLSTQDRRIVEASAESATKSEPLCGLTPPELALCSFAPVHTENIPPSLETLNVHALLTALLKMEAALKDVPGLQRRIQDNVRVAAFKSRYVPLAAQATWMASFRNSHITLPTFASGKWVGLDPGTQGNSETGHQQIGSLVMAPQTSMQITETIKTGDFFKNKALNDVIRLSRSSEGNVNFCFLLSGETPEDGRVHSAWSHLEAFVKLIFSDMAVPPDKVRMQVILDGRDSGICSSMEKSRGFGGYLEKLGKLLYRYDAVEVLAWVVGRNIAMDRDYREEAAQADWRLLTEGKGIRVRNFEEVCSIVKRFHTEGVTDQDIPPIAVTDRRGLVRKLQTGDAFINLNFRSDRQRIKTAVLTNASSFLNEETAVRNRRWSREWMDNNLRLHYCAMAPYDPRLDSQNSVSIAFPNKPLTTSLLSIWGDIVSDHKYVLIGESVKGSHMGYFIRGAREIPVHPKKESRFILPSVGREEGVESDSDFYKFPAMRSRSIADGVISQMKLRENSLIICNLAAPDMLGHLLPLRFKEAIAAYEATGSAIQQMVEPAIKAGWNVILTADHGNIETDGPSHTSNEVLTTFASRGAAFTLPAKARFEARLFDISYTIARIQGLGELADQTVQDSPFPLGHEMAGRCLLDF